MRGASDGVGSGADGDTEVVEEALSGTSAGSNGCWSAACCRCEDTVR